MNGVSEKGETQSNLLCFRSTDRFTAVCRRSGVMRGGGDAEEMAVTTRRQAPTAQSFSGDRGPRRRHGGPARAPSPGPIRRLCGLRWQDRRCLLCRP